MKSLFLTVVLAVSAFGQELSEQEIVSAFNSAGREFGVPPDILKGIAFSETRWQHVTWAEGDTASCTGLPHVYGIMALRDDPFFGRSLPAAAALIGETPATLRRDLIQNIRGAAAYLKSLYAHTSLPDGTTSGSLESWQSTMALYCGIPQPELAMQHATEILLRLQKGYDRDGIRIDPAPVNMTAVRANAAKVYASITGQALEKRTAQTNYPPAHWAPAYPGHWYTTGSPKDFVVIHDMEGYYLSVISYFQQSSTDASIHFDVNGLQDSPSDAPAGDITQQVEERYWAWHAICLNRYSFGIEHEGFASNPAWFTPEMYLASAKLVAYLCETYGIPKDRNHIIGHNEYQNTAWVNWAVSHGYPPEFGTCNSHTDPGINWDWPFFMQLITRDSTAPRVTSQPPAGRVAVFEGIAVTFSQRMEPAGTERSFHLSPDLPGTISWKNNFRTLQFTPSTPFSFDAEYAVTVDTGAQNYFRAGLDVNGDGVGGEVYGFTFRTVAHDTIPPVLTSTYPADHQTGISTSVQFELEVSEPMDPTTLGGSWELRDDTGGTLTLTAPIVQSNGTGIRITFRPAVPLPASASYTLNVLPSMQDYGGNTIAALRTASFTTEPERSFSGTVINTLDAPGSWWQPGTSGSTVGTITTSFAIDTEIRKNGAGSGKVTYLFSGPAGGRVREYNSAKPAVDPGPQIGAWVFGDNSRNALWYWFYPGAGGSVFTGIPVGTLDWTGWKFVATSIANVPTTAARQFAGFVIEQVAGGRTSGTVYFDDLAVVQTLTSTGNIPPALPEAYLLLQNFPNPFNPSTTIRYGVPARAHVDLSVFNTLGQEVAHLFSGEVEAGFHDVFFDASHLASGVYFYKIQARTTVAVRSGTHATPSDPGFVASRKLLLLR